MSTGYYSGGARIIVGGIPCRVARKPSKVNLSNLREFERDRTAPLPFPRGRGGEKAKRLKQQAQNEVKAYADALGISRNSALRRIALQIRHLDANPMIDNSAEYDL